MAKTRHPDALELLRFALWGTADVAPETADHMRTCTECGAEAALIRRARDAVQVAGAGPSEAAVAATSRAVVGVRCEPPALPDLDVSWLTAQPVGSLAGVRSGDAAERVVRCDDGDLRLDVLVHEGGGRSGDDALRLSGQVLLEGETPGADLEVTLFLDRRPAGTVRTDAFGEFALGAPRARQVGVRIEGSGRPRHVELWSEGASR